MGDKGWLCVICGHFIDEVLPNQILPEGGRVHTYCLEVEKATEDRIIKLLESQTHDLLFGEHNTFACCLCSHLRLIKGEQK